METTPGFACLRIYLQACAVVAVFPGYIVEMERCEVFDGKHFRSRGAERGYDLQIATAFLTDLNPHSFACASGAQVPKSAMVFVPAARTAQAELRPVSAALAASQMFGLIIILQFTQCCTAAAYVTIIPLPLARVGKGRQLPMPRAESRLKDVLPQSPQKIRIELKGRCRRCEPGCFS